MSADYRDRDITGVEAWRGEGDEQNVLLFRVHYAGQDRPLMFSLNRNRVLSLIEVLKGLAEGGHEHERYPVKKEETRCLPLPL